MQKYAELGYLDILDLVEDKLRRRIKFLFWEHFYCSECKGKQ